MALLTVEAISQMPADLRVTSCSSVVIDCVRVGSNPCMERILPGTARIRFSGITLKLFPLHVMGVLRSSDDGPLILLCDLDAQGIMPQNGQQLSHASRVERAMSGILSCLLTLVAGQSIDSQAIRSLLFAQPARLIVGTIEDGTIVIQDGRGREMVEALRR